MDRVPHRRRRADPLPCRRRGPGRRPDTDARAVDLRRRSRRPLRPGHGTRRDDHRRDPPARLPGVRRRRPRRTPLDVPPGAPHDEVVMARLRERNEWKFFAVLPRADRALASTWWTVLLLRGALPALFSIAM